MWGLECIVDGKPPGGGLQGYLAWWYGFGSVVTSCCVGMAIGSWFFNDVWAICVGMLFDEVRWSF